jgi:hypothetical protein
MAHAIGQIGEIGHLPPHPTQDLGGAARPGPAQLAKETISTTRLFQLESCEQIVATQLVVLAGLTGGFVARSASRSFCLTSSLVP